MKNQPAENPAIANSSPDEAQAGQLGFSLKEIKELLALRVDPTTTCDQIRKTAEAKIADVEERIASLQRIKKALKKLVASCTGRGPISECPILESLEPQQKCCFMTKRGAPAMS